MKKLFQKLIGILTAVMLLVTYAVPVMADEHDHNIGTEITEKPTAPNKYTITLTAPAGVTIDDDAVYGAYQVFSGSVPEHTGNYENPGDKNDTLPITDIKWGNAFGDVTTSTGKTTWQNNIVNFVIALAKAPSDTAHSYAFGDFKGFEGFVNSDKSRLADRFYNDYVEGEAFTGSTDNSDVNFDKLAVEVAQEISKHQDREWLQAFVDILGGYAAGEGGYANPSYVNRYYKSTKNGDNWEIEVPAGYYMVRDLTSIDDSSSTDDSEAYSARMLFVASNVTQELKEGVPTLEKTIARDGGSFETEAAGVGDEVTFELTGTLPSNYDSYIGGYQYKFVDTLSKGLTLDTETSGDITAAKTVAVTIKVLGAFKVTTDGGVETKTWDSTADLELTADSVELLPDHTHITDDNAYTATMTRKDGIEELTVAFPCLREVRIKKGTDTYCLGYDTESNTSSKICVTYKATVTKDAVITSGNQNKAQIEYSSNPAAYADTNWTTVDEANVYTFGLDIEKVDAAEFIKNDGDVTGTGVPLEGVEFAIVRQKPDGKAGEYQIAKFTQLTEADIFEGSEYNSIVEWTDLPTAVSAENSLSSIVGAFVDIVANSDYIITTDADGKLLVSGLDDGIEYTVVETKAKSDQYAKIDPFTITLTAETSDDSGIEEYTGTLSGAKASNTFDSTKALDSKHYVQVTEPAAGKADADGAAGMIVANYKYEDLPSTGGMGTYLIYIAGGVIILISAVLFFLSRRKTEK